MLKLIVSLNNRAGVPVFNLDKLILRFLSLFDRPITGGSSILPPGVVFLPQNITPLRKVPVVSTTEAAKNVSPFLHKTP